MIHQDRECCRGRRGRVGSRLYGASAKFRDPVSEATTLNNDHQLWEPLHAPFAASSRQGD